MHKRSAFGLCHIEARTGSPLLRPAGSPPPLQRRLDPTYSNGPVARTRPVGRYTLNRQFAWEAPLILQDRKHLLSAYMHLNFEEFKINMLHYTS
jgi:hypothetical protein